LWGFLYTACPFRIDVLRKGISIIFANTGLNIQLKKFNPKFNSFEEQKAGGGLLKSPEFDIFEHIIAGIQPATGGLRRISVQKAACRRAT
jgi:hypothetical protein